VRIEIPALRDRRADVPLIAQHFLKRFVGEMGKEVTGFTPEAMKVVGYYDYPGNVRELENLVERALTFENSDQITVESLPPRMLGATEETGGSMTVLELPESGMDLESVLSRMERHLLTQALERTGGHRTEAAKLLGISFRSIRYKLEKYSIVVDDTEGS
jgi:two-component system response regulator PilR (NtrC family)